MVENEQVKSPYTTSKQERGNKDTAINLKKAIYRSKFIKCCVFSATIVIILATVIIALIFTVFKGKDFAIKINGTQVNKVDLINGTNVPRPGTNISITVDVSVKNPSFSSFRYSSNTTTSLYYNGSFIGEARSPPGESRARRTMRMNVTVDIIVDDLVRVPNLQSDMGRGLITMSSYTVVGGRIKFLSFIKKHVVVRVRCKTSFNLTSMAIQGQKCKKNVKL